MSKHTPGPWHTEVVQGGVMGPHVVIRGPVGEWVGHVYDEDQPRGEADVTLMAAAPALLEALRECVQVMARFGDVWGPTLDDARAAIAQAEGRKPYDPR